jgi:hypothetical protein
MRGKPQKCKDRFGFCPGLLLAPFLCLSDSDLLCSFGITKVRLELAVVGQEDLVFGLFELFEGGEEVCEFGDDGRDGGEMGEGFELVWLESRSRRILCLCFKRFKASLTPSQCHERRIDYRGGERIDLAFCQIADFLLNDFDEGTGPVAQFEFAILVASTGGRNSALLLLCGNVAADAQ